MQTLTVNPVTWYAHSTHEERVKVIVSALVAHGWVSSHDGQSAISGKGYVARLDSDVSRWLEVFCNGRKFCDADMRGFHPNVENAPYSIDVILKQFLADIQIKERELRL